MWDCNDLLTTTSQTVIRLMKHKNWWDWLLLYMRLMIQTRIQQSNDTRSDDSFMREALWWWVERLRNAKKILIDEWLITTNNIQNEEWVITWRRVIVNFITNCAVLASNSKVDREVVLPTDGSRPLMGERATNNIYNNNYNNNNYNNYNSINTITEKTGFSVSEETEIKTWRKKWVKRTDLDDIISSMKQTLTKGGFSYSNVKERIFAKNLADNIEWKKLVEESWISSWEMVRTIIQFTNDDSFWRGKITSTSTLYYKWSMLVNLMKASWSLKIVNREDDKKRKEDAISYFNSIR